MTDRVQQMLDVVKQDFETAIKKPRGRRAKAIMRAEVREGILKNPRRSQSEAPETAELRDSQVGYSGPRRPDLWRNEARKGIALPAHPKGGLKIDPAEAALAAFQVARMRPHRDLPSRPTFEEISLDRPRIDDGPLRSESNRSRSRFRRRAKDTDELTFDSRRGSEKGKTKTDRRRGSWIRALRGSRGRR